MDKIKPIISEKTVALAKKGYFSVEISRDATKPRITQMLKRIFSLNAVSIKMSNRKPQIVKKMRGIALQRATKKAIVGLKKGEKFPGFEIAFGDEKSKTKVKKTGKAQKSEVVK